MNSKLISSFLRLKFIYKIVSFYSFTVFYIYTLLYYTTSYVFNFNDAPSMSLRLVYSFLTENPLWDRPPGVDFINILRANFFCTKVLCEAFLYLHFGFVIFGAKVLS